MKEYRITKIIFAKNFADALKKEKEAEIVDMCLNEEVSQDIIKSKLGFKNENN